MKIDKKSLYRLSRRSEFDGSFSEDVPKLHIIFISTRAYIYFLTCIKIFLTSGEAFVYEVCFGDAKKYCKYLEI